MVEYKHNSFSITKRGMEIILDTLTKNNITNVLEFGSGASTDHLAKLGYNIVSFDDDKKYASKNKGVQVVDLIQLTDQDFEKVMNGSIDYFKCIESYSPYKQRSSKQRNCFYKLKLDFISDLFPFVLLDGPNGNGRSISYRVIENFLTPECYIFIDDYFHHPFIENLKRVFINVEEIVTVKENKNKGFALYKITK